MGLYERRPMRSGASPSAPSPPRDRYDDSRHYGDPSSGFSRPVRGPRASERQHYAPAAAFLRPAFPQDDSGALRPQIQVRTTQDRAAAADNLLSLIQSRAPGRNPGEGDVGQRGAGPGRLVRRGEPTESYGSTSDDQTPPVAPKRPVGRPRKRPVHDGEEVAVKRPVGRPRIVDEDKDADLKRKRRDKKPTYIVRREKKALLEAELVELKKQVVALRRASGIPDSFFIERERLVARIEDNKRLRAESRKQDMLLRNAHSIMCAEYLMKCPESPIETFIHLTTDLKQRRSALVSMKEMKLAQADAFITERSKYLPITKPWCQESKFETSEGHFCAEKLDNTPFHGVQSVRQVFEALQFFFWNMEISISEMLGDITVREDDDSTSSNSFSNHRLVSTMSHGVQVEKNVVKFFKLVDPDVDDEEDEGGEGKPSYALVATDSVDIDDMYPYVPDERVRMDINAAMKFTEHFCKKPANRRQRQPDHHRYYGGYAEEEEYERVVVLTRFFRVKLHHTEMDLPPHVLQEVRQGLACFSDTMVQSMHRVIFESQQ